MHPGRNTHLPALNSSVDQTEVIRFMADPATHAGSCPIHIQTHLSHIFLTGTQAYKLKRACRFNFVDYTELDRRHFYCSREIEVNRTWAGDLYKGVLPVRRSEHGLHLGGSDGQIVEWLVHMHRFPDQDRLDRRLAAGLTDDIELEAFADDLARIHAHSPPVKSHGGATDFLQVIEQVSCALRNVTHHNETLGQITHWRERIQQMTKTKSRALDRRTKDGRIKICHSDLHLKNIVLWKGRLTGFDAIEFDDSLRTIDQLYDLSFAIMDLLHFGYRYAGSLLLNRYLARTGDYNGLGVLRLYLSMRAAIRALTSALAGQEADMAAYLRASLAYLAAPAPPAIGGLSGSGKSTVARLSAPHIGLSPGAVVLRSDVIRKLILGYEPEEKIPLSAYDNETGMRVYDVIRDTCAEVIGQGYDCILDATFLNQENRSWIEPLAVSLGVNTTFIWLDAAPEDLLKRIDARDKDASDADKLILFRQLEKNTPDDWIRIDTTPGPDQTAQRVIDEAMKAHAKVFIQPDKNPAHDV